MGGTYRQRREQGQLARRLLDAWDIEPRSVRLIADDTNAVYRVDAAGGDRFVLRISHVRVCHDATEARSELAWLAALAADTDLAVPQVVGARDGEVLVPVGDGGPWRHATLFRWMPGFTIGRRLGTPSARAAGEVVARLHGHAGRFRLPGGYRARRGDRVLPWSSTDFTDTEPVLLFERRFHDLYPPRMRPVYVRAYARAEAAIGDLFEGRSKPRLIHNDLHPWNLRSFRGEIGVFDFEDLVLGHPVQDIATFTHYFRTREDGERLSRAFRAGYERRRPWPVESAAQLDALVSARALVLANFLLAGLDDFGRDEVRGWLARIGGRLLRWSSAGQSPDRASSS